MMKTKEEIKKHIFELLKSVMDPEIELNIVDLGLIYNLEIEDDKKVNIEMTLSTPACPLGDAIIINVKETIKQHYPEYEVNVNLVFDPPWNPSLISEEGKAKLGM